MMACTIGSSGRSKGNTYSAGSCELNVHASENRFRRRSEVAPLEQEKVRTQQLIVTEEFSLVTRSGLARLDPSG